MANRSDRITPEMRERGRRTREELKGRPGIEQLLTPGELAEATPFYFALRCFVADVRSARDARGISLEEVAQKSSLAVEVLEQLEAGSQVNPSWQTLAKYAAAVGCTVHFHAEPSARNED